MCDGVLELYDDVRMQNPIKCKPGRRKAWGLRPIVFI